MTLGATPFSIYATSSPEQITYVVGDAKARSRSSRSCSSTSSGSARERAARAAHLVLLEGAGRRHRSAGTTSRRPSPTSTSRPPARGRAEDLITLIYTSGTTGPPKGVQLVHRNLMPATKGVEQLIRFPDGSKVISWLPSAHIAERMAHHYLPIVYAMTITTCPNPREVVATCRPVRPTWFFAVPRIWEKLKAGMGACWPHGEGGEQKRRLLDAAIRKVELEQAGEPGAGGTRRDRRALPTSSCSRRSGPMLGFRPDSAVNVGAAPTPREVLRVLPRDRRPARRAVGDVGDLRPGAMQSAREIKIGTVARRRRASRPRLARRRAADPLHVVMEGLPQPARQDGRGARRRRLAATRRHRDDRRRRLHRDRRPQEGDIINAAGKNMSPANIESTIKGAGPDRSASSPVIGDRRPYNTALIVLDSDFAPAWRRPAGDRGRKRSRRCENEQIRAVGAGRPSTRQRRARAGGADQEVHDHRRRLGPGGDELTPTMKLKRKPIAEKYACGRSRRCTRSAGRGGHLFQRSPWRRSAAGASPAAAVNGMSRTW
jgi:hypothetical protein